MKGLTPNMKKYSCVAYADDFSVACGYGRMKELWTCLAYSLEEAEILAQRHFSCFYDIVVYEVEE